MIARITFAAPEPITAADLRRIGFELVIVDASPGHPKLVTLRTLNPREVTA